jgi:hypothetical protein
MMKRTRYLIGSALAVVVAVAGGIAVTVPAQASSSTTGPSSPVAREDGTNDGETADDQGVEDGAHDGETADDQGVEDGTQDGETAND